MQTVSRTLFHHFKLDYPSSKQKTKQIKQNQTNPTQRLVKKKKRLHLTNLFSTYLFRKIIVSYIKIEGLSKTKLILSGAGSKHILI